MADVQQQFENAWHEVQAEVDPAKLEKDELWFWWPTLQQAEPNYDVLVQKLLDFGLSPHLSLLTVYWYGYAKALNDLMFENIRPCPVNQAQRSTAPAWLEELVWTDLADRFGERH